MNDGSSPGRAAPLVMGLVAATLACGGGALLLYQRLVQTQGELTQTRTEKEQLAQQFDQLQAKQRSAEERVETIQNQLRTATQDLDRTRQQLEEAQDRATTLRQGQEELETQLKTLRESEANARQEITRLEQEKAEAVRTAQRMRARLALVERDFNKLQQRVGETTGTVSNQESRLGPSSVAPAAEPSRITGTVELPPVVLRQGQLSDEPLRARIVQVNAAQRFIILDRGSTDGVRLGMQFDLLRGNASIGHAIAVRLRPNLTACDLHPTDMSTDVQVGDVAVGHPS